MRTARITSLAVFLAMGVCLCGNAVAQNEATEHEYFRKFDLNDDGFVNMIDVNVWHGFISQIGDMGRGVSIDVVPGSEFLDLNLDFVYTLEDVLAILNNFGHFDVEGNFQRAPAGCIMGDFNEDGDVDDEDMNCYFKLGFQWWSWENSQSPINVRSIYSMGDIDMNGEVDIVDFCFMRLLWTAGTRDFDSKYSALEVLAPPMSQPEEDLKVSVQRLWFFFMF